MVILVNKFTLQTEPEHFEEVFNASSEFMVSQPGFINHTLVKSLSDPKIYVNIAEWESADAHLAVIASEGFRTHISTLATVATAEPGLYSVVKSVEAVDA